MHLYFIYATFANEHATQTVFEPLLMFFLNFLYIQDRFEAIGIKPPKGVLMYGPPGTGKTLMARACAAQTNSCFLKLAGPQLVQVSVILSAHADAHARAVPRTHTLHKNVQHQPSTHTHTCTCTRTQIYGFFSLI